MHGHGPGRLSDLEFYACGETTPMNSMMGVSLNKPLKAMQAVL